VKFIRRVLAALVVLVIFFFLVRSLVRNWKAIPFADLHFNPFYLLLSFFFLLLTFLTFVRAWQAIIRALGGDISCPFAFWVMAASQTAKYVPGGVWFALGRVYLAKDEKLSAATIGVSVIIETGLTFLAGILLFFLALSLARPENLVNYLLLVPVFLFFLLVLYPPVLERLVNIGLKIFRRQTVRIELSYGSLLRIAVYYLGLWLAQIIGYFLLINALYPVALGQFPSLAAIYIISWMAGFIIILAPGGLGVREGTMTLLLSSIIPSALAIGISFLSRVWITVFEILIFFAGLIIYRRRGRSGAAKSRLTPEK
jgi:uncharacterized membrane protein YbhN (UPF0104 family)